MTQQTPQNVIHYDLTRVDYSLTPSELDRFETAASNTWKDFCILCFSVGSPCLLNSIAEIVSQDKFIASLL